MYNYYIHTLNPTGDGLSIIITLYYEPFKYIIAKDNHIISINNIEIKYKLIFVILFINLK